MTWSDYFVALEDSADTNHIRRGEIAGVPAPPGGGAMLFAFNSALTADGACSLLLGADDFAPAENGSMVEGCLQRGPGGGPTGFSVFLFAQAQGDSVNDSGYMLGLSDEDPYRLVLRKGTLAQGVGKVGDPGVLRVSSKSYRPGQWHHLRLETIRQRNGDVFLAVFENDLDEHPLGTPSNWTPISGMDPIFDDHVAVNTGSLPFTSGYMGFGFQSAAVTRRGFVDALRFERQTLV